MTRRAFASYHPAVQLVFFAGMVVLCILLQHPAFQALCLLSAVLTYLDLRGVAGLRFLLGMAFAFALVALLNPLFVTLGDDVLFVYFGRPYTLQALAYGVSMAAMFASIVIWFSCYSRIVTSDRFTYLFGGVAPAVTLALTMVMRLVPAYRRKALRMVRARACIGRSASEGSLRERAREGGSVLFALTSWAFDSSIVSADSMRARGFGSGKRTSYANYELRAHDVILLAVLAASFGAVAFFLASGAIYADYLPVLEFSGPGNLVYLALACLSVYAFSPLVIDLRGGLAWQSSMSRT